MSLAVTLIPGLCFDVSQLQMRWISSKHQFAWLASPMCVRVTNNLQFVLCVYGNKSIGFLSIIEQQGDGGRGEESRGKGSWNN